MLEEVIQGKSTLVSITLDEIALQKLNLMEKKDFFLKTLRN